LKNGQRGAANALKTTLQLDVKPGRIAADLPDRAPPANAQRQRATALGEFG
jgi:hypothetical protein